MASEVGSAVTTPAAGKMSHSHSLPAAVDAVSLPDAASGADASAASAKQRSGKMLFVTVTMLDDIQVTFHVQHKALGQELFELVCKQLSLLEVDYFGLEYEDSNRTKYWLDLEKPMNRQLGLSTVDCSVQFGVKFYTPDPAQLEEEYTRYLFCLQIKKDLVSGTLQCNENTAAIMASYIVQADCGDYVADDYPDHLYLTSYKFVPHQNEELERRIMEHHKRHIGQSPAEADLNLLETVRRCELYGIRMHPAKDHEGVPLNLAVAHMGVLVFQNFTKINTFSWAKVRKLSFKRKRFLIKLHPEGYASPNAEGGSSCQGYYKDTVEFYFESRNECKNFWKKCVEHHGFFRCNTVKKLPRQKTRVLSRGSSFRYCGRTQKQIVDYVRENFIKRQPFQRSQSFRHSSSAHSGLGHVPNSRSSQPLYPVGDHSVGTPASHSCGSMVLNDDQSDSTEAAGASPSPMARGEMLDAAMMAAAADVHSERSPSSSPKHQQLQQRSPDVEVVANGTRMADEAASKDKIDKGGGENYVNGGCVRGGRGSTLLHNQSSTESPVSRGSSSAKDRADDSISQDSYQLLDAAEVDPAAGSSSSLTLQSNPRAPASAENEQGKGLMTRRFEGDPCGGGKAKQLGLTGSSCECECRPTLSNSINSTNGDSKRPTSDSILSVANFRAAMDNGDDVFTAPLPLPSSKPPPPPPPPRRPSSSMAASASASAPKMTQSSPVLYARSSLRTSSTTSTGDVIETSSSPKSPHSRNFVHLSSLPARHSYSSKDDSLNGNGGCFEHHNLQHRKRSSSSLASSNSSCNTTTTTQSSQSQSDVDLATLEPLRIVEDCDMEKLSPASCCGSAGPAPFHGTVRSTMVQLPTKSFAAEMVRKGLQEQEEDEWDKLAATFPPPPPPPLQDISPPVEKVDSIQEARSKFLANTILMDIGDSSPPLLPPPIHSLEDYEDTDNEATVTYVEESCSDTGEQMTVIDNYVAPPGRTNSAVVTMAELDLDDDQDCEKNKDHGHDVLGFVKEAEADEINKGHHGLVDEDCYGTGFQRCVTALYLDKESQEDKAGHRDFVKTITEAYTTFRSEESEDQEQEHQDQNQVEEEIDEEVTVSVHDDTANGETESLPREVADLDDDYEDLEPHPSSSLQMMMMEDTLLLYPVRTLSRISERSTSEQSESKDDSISTPTHESKPSDDRHPSVGELPSDYSTSDDNPEDSPSRGRAPGTGSGLGLSPIRSYETVATIEAEEFLSLRTTAAAASQATAAAPPPPAQVLFETMSDGEGSQVETYYMEIDSVQKERLEKEGVFDKVPYVEPEVAAGEESSSADNDTLCEEHSFVDFLSDISPEENWRDAATPTATLVTPTSACEPPHKELYEGLGVTIPARSPTSPIKTTPEPPASDTRVRHRISVELQVSKGVFSETKPATVSTLRRQESVNSQSDNDQNDFDGRN